MVRVDMKALIRRLNRFCSRALEGAAGLCVSRGHYEVTVEHLFLKLLEEPSADRVDDRTGHLMNRVFGLACAELRKD